MSVINSFVCESDKLYLCFIYFRMIAYMFETQFICYHMPFLSNNQYVYTFESNKSTKQGNEYFYFIINSFIFTNHHYSSLFATFRTIRSHYSVFSLANRSSFERDNDVFVFGLYIFTPKEFTNMGQ